MSVKYFVVKSVEIKINNHVYLNNSFQHVIFPEEKEKKYLTYFDLAKLWHLLFSPVKNDYSIR